MAGLRRGERRADRLEVAHLAEEDHVGVLTQRGAQRVAEAVRVDADLAPLLLLRGKDAVEERLRRLRIERGQTVETLEIPADARSRRRPDRDVQVGRAEPNSVLEQLVDGKRCVRHASNELSAGAASTFTPSETATGIPHLSVRNIGSAADD